MKSYTKTYMKFFGYHLSDWMPCEICGNQAVDLHHIEARGMGGSETKDNIQNLMALCRGHHIQFGDKKQHKEMLKEVHFNFMKNNAK